MTPRRSSKWVGAGRAGAVGLELAVSVVAGLVLGDYLDRRLGSSPWLTLGLVLAGMVAGVFRIIREFGSPNQKD